ncbi:hypothetical protein HDG34_006445 [Paraburkholderia sp. HC6.4b]|nr:hypothetical protein [Paraburkholderia sp. HC6.4b]MBB5454645.1 hypothetical protein [Paraburkholderia sp. Kb1A]
MTTDITKLAGTYNALLYHLSPTANYETVATNAVETFDAMLTAEFIAVAGPTVRFRSPDALASAAGLAPVLKQSGKSSWLKRPQKGDKRLKRIFYQSAFASMRCPESAAFYARKRKEGKRHHQIIIALARRRVNVLWAIGRYEFENHFGARSVRTVAGRVRRRRQQ